MGRTGGRGGVNGAQVVTESKVEGSVRVSLVWAGSSTNEISDLINMLCKRWEVTEMLTFTS